MKKHGLFRMPFCILLFLSSFSLVAQDISEKIPLDSKVKIGKLKNGLTYIIRENKKPENKVELRLVLNAGSINEDDDQQGLAHMTEHMAFNGTKNFKKNDIVSYLQDIGVGFGSDLNAYTSFDETVYMLPIPTDKPDNLEKGFKILEDWAHKVTNLTADIDGERPIILEESRRGKGAQERMRRKIFPHIFAGSLYAKRIPIGKDSIIKNFKPEALRRFYKDWYRPDLMAVIVVGDITTAKAEELIHKHFDGLKAKKGRERSYAELPPYKENDAVVVSDKEATSSMVSINYPAFKQAPDVTLSDWRNKFYRNLVTMMFNERLRELTQKENPPFTFGGSYFGSMARGYNGFTLYAGVGTGDVKKAVQVVTEELEKVKRFGFTEAELERSKKRILNDYERSYNNRDKTESRNFVDEYIRYFLEGEPSPGIEYEFEKAKLMLPPVKITEVNGVVDQYIKGDRKRCVIVMSPEPKEGEKLPTGQEIMAVIAAAESADVKPYEDKVQAEALIDRKPTPGKVVSKKNNPVIGATELTLSNGIKVILKSTDFKTDQILMNSVRAGGKNNYGLADKYNAEYAVPVVQAMGVGNFSPLDLSKMLSGKSAGAYPYFSNVSEGVNGNSSVKDVETMFQLAWLYFTQPRMDTSLFKSFQQRNKSQYAMLLHEPQFAFMDTVFTALFDNNPLAPVMLPKPEYYDKINLNRAVEIYKERFSDATGMEFVLVGSFKENDLIPLIEQYIASLPATGKKFSYVDNKVRQLKGKKSLLCKKGSEEKSFLVQAYWGEMPYNEYSNMLAQASTEVLNIRIIEELREKIGGIYGGGIGGGLSKVPFESYQFMARLPCGPEKAGILLKALNKEIDDIATTGPSQKNLDKVKKQWIENYKEEVKTNESWMGAITGSLFPGTDIDYFINKEKYINKITVKEVQGVAAKLFRSPNIFTCELMPENFKGEDKK